MQEEIVFFELDRVNYNDHNWGYIFLFLFIITDNAKNLNNELIDQVCQQFKIEHRNLVPYIPQMDGAVQHSHFYYHFRY